MCVVFHNLDPVSRLRAIEALQELLKNNLQPETYVGLFNLSDRLTPIYRFTNNRTELAQAVQNAFTLQPIDLVAAVEPVLTANPTQMTIAAVVNNATRSATVTARVTGGEVSRTLVTGAEVSTSQGANTMRGIQVTDSRDFSHISGMRETDRIITMVNELGPLPGRKSVLLVTTGMLTTGDPERMEAIVAKANQQNLTFYSFDIGGMRENSTIQARESRPRPGGRREPLAN